MPHKQPDVLDAFTIDEYKRTKRARPLVRAFAVPTSAMRPIPLGRLGDLSAKMKPGEKLVLWIEPDDLASQDEAVIMKAVHAVVKVRREALGARSFPSPDAFEMYRLRAQGMTYRKLAERFSDPDADDPGGNAQENAERRVKRLVRQVRDLLARSEKREQAALTPRQRTILKAYARAIASGELPPVEPVND